MRGQKINRLEKSRDEWYQSHHQSSPSSRKKNNSLTLSINFDTHTYTKTDVFKPFCPYNNHQTGFNEFENNYYYGNDKYITYWGKGGVGVEPIDFSRTLSILREKTAMSPYKINLAPIGKINDCFTPYQNDQMTYDALEAARNELRHRAEHIALEMRRVDDLWNTEPAANILLRSGNQSLENSHQNARSSSVQRRSSHSSNSKKSKRNSRSYL